MMPPQVTTMFQAIAALIAGALIGAGFGIVQESARRRNERLQQSGKIKSGWAVMPGSGKRIMGLILVLVCIQLVCPIWFKEGIRWWVSGGLAAGYGFMLFWQLRHRLSDTK